MDPWVCGFMNMNADSWTHERIHGMDALADGQVETLDGVGVGCPSCLNFTLQQF